MSWTSPLTVASTIVPLPPESSVRSMCGSRCATAAFMTSADCSTNGSCISPRPKSSPTVRMPASRWSLMMSSALCPVASASSRSAPRPLASPSTMRRCSRSPSGQGGQLRGAVGARGGGVHALEHVEEHLQGVVRDVPVGVAPAAVVDEVEGDLALVLGDPRHREDLGRVHDRRVEPRLDGLVQEHRVEHDPRGGVEAEGDVRDAERRLHLRVAALDLADRLDGRQPVAARLLLAGGDREGQAVDEDVVDPHAPAAGERLDQPDGDVDLVLDRAGLALLVDRQRDDGRAVLARRSA